MSLNGTVVKTEFSLSHDCAEFLEYRTDSANVVANLQRKINRITDQQSLCDRLYDRFLADPISPTSQNALHTATKRLHELTKGASLCI